MARQQSIQPRLLQQGAQRDYLSPEDLPRTARKDERCVVQEQGGFIVAYVFKDRTSALDYLERRDAPVEVTPIKKGK